MTRTLLGRADGAAGPLATISVTVGTAGHIDHGKTQLVRFFTGCETDRLPEEKARGMTIDLGFATCVLPNNRRVGIVDVPGHERFIHNMVAGASGIDVAMLVVAADDGVMPQTVEHFHILRLLGVSAGLVALTKIDLVEPARVAEVADQVRELASGSFLENAPICPVSSKTGEGFDAFYDTFVETVDRTAQRDASGAFRMHVERSFIIKGHGCIVSGIPRSGRVETGETIEILPAGTLHKVRSLQVYGRPAERGVAGECVALNLSELAQDEVGRGMVLATPRTFEPSRFVNVRLHLLPDLARPLRPRTAVRFHVGTADVPGQLVLPDLSALPAGADTYAQLQLQRPVVAAPGDFFIVRLLSPARTLGGGCVVMSDTMRMRRTRGDWMSACLAHEAAFRAPDTAVQYVLEHASESTLQRADVQRRSMTSAEACTDALARLVASGRACELPGGRYAAADRLAAIKEELLGAIGGLHDDRPLALGFTRREWIPRITAERVLLDRAEEELIRDGVLENAAQGLRLKARAPRLSERQTALAARISELYRQAAFATPRRDELPEQLGAPAPIIGPVLDYLLESGELVPIDERIIFHREVVEESRRLILAHFESHPQLGPADIKELLATTRKYTIPLLEYWDRQGLTRRSGDGRVLRP